MLGKKTSGNTLRDMMSKNSSLVKGCKGYTCKAYDSTCISTTGNHSGDDAFLAWHIDIPSLASWLEPGKSCWDQRVGFFTCLNYLKDMSMFATPSVGMNKEWCFLYMPYLNVIDAPPPGPTRLSSFQRMPSQLHQFGVWPQMFDKFCMDAERTAWFMNVYEISWE